MADSKENYLGDLRSESVKSNLHQQKLQLL